MKERTPEIICCHCDANHRIEVVDAQGQSQNHLVNEDTITGFRCFVCNSDEVRLRKEGE